MSSSSDKKDLSPQDSAKRQAAYEAVDALVTPGMRLGIGSGSTVVFVVERLVELVRGGKLKDLLCVPTSFQSTQLIIASGGALTLTDLSRTPELDLALDGADEVDDNLNCIKGGGACMLQEKIVAASAKKFVVVADETKDSKRLGEKWKKGIPLEVVPMAHVPVMNKLKAMGGKPVLRMAGEKKAGPVVTDNGNFVVDVDFGLLGGDSGRDVAQLDQQLQAIVGVVETGLFVGMASKAYFGNKDGSVSSR